MKDGEVVQIGTPEEIMMSPANEFVEIRGGCEFRKSNNGGIYIKTTRDVINRPWTTCSTSNYEKCRRFYRICCKQKYEF